MERIHRVVAVCMAAVVLIGMVFRGDLPMRTEAATSVMINAASFPDTAFRSYVSKNFDVDGDGYLSESEREKVRTIEVEGKGVTTLKGLEYFQSVWNVSCENNKLDRIDLQGNKELKYLDCSSNNLAELDVSSNGSLTTLYCGYNHLRELNLRNNPYLSTLKCEHNADGTGGRVSESNGLRELDLRKNTQLVSLVCDHNKLTALNLENNTQLENLNCSYNRLTSLNLSKIQTSAASLTLDASHNGYTIGVLGDGTYNLAGLEPFGFESGKVNRWIGAVEKANILVDITADHIDYEYNCGKGKIITFSLDAGIYIDQDNFPDEVFRDKLKEYDLDGNGALSQSEGQKIKILNLSNLGIKSLEGIGIFSCLEELYCDRNSITALDLGQNTRLQTLNCSENPLATLNVRGCQVLTKLISYSTRLTRLELDTCTALQEVRVYDNQLTGIDIDNCVLLKVLDVHNNQLTELDLRYGRNLEEIRAYNNQLGILDAGNCTKLKILDVCNNQLTRLNVENCQYLDFLKANNNRLTDLDVSTCTYITNIDAYDNQLVNLLVDHCSRLQVLDVHNNQLTELHLNDCSGLKKLIAHSNQLSQLKLAGCPLLENLFVYGNKIAVFDAGICPELIELDIRDNGLTKLLLSGCKKLVSLNCADNGLTALDLSDCAELKQKELNTTGNIYAIGPVSAGEGFALSALEKNGFNARKAFQWTGAAEKDGKLTDFTAKNIGYQYECGNGLIAQFTLTIDEVPHVHEYRGVTVEPTCTEQGYTEYICDGCGDHYIGDYVPVLGHAYETTLSPATWNKAGTIVTKCVRCGTVASTVSIRGIVSVALTKTSFVYDGIYKKPVVVAKDTAGQVIPASAYTVSYSNNLKAGTGQALVVFKGNYTGSRSLSFTINPPSSRLLKVTKQAGALKVKWEKQPRQVTGYQILCSEKKNFAEAKTRKITSKSIGITTKKIKNLKRKFKYYVKVRTYVVVDGLTYYSGWSSVVSGKTK